MNRTVLLCLLCLSPVAIGLPPKGHLGGGPLPPPYLQFGKHVYTVPEETSQGGGFAPPGVGQTGIVQLNGELSKLHFPFKVVFVDKLPDLDAVQHEWARKEGFRGDENTLRIEVATARLAEDWATNQPDLFRVGTDSVFVLSFEPRKFAWSPGTTWRTTLGVTPGPAQDVYTGLFVAKVRQKPSDPVGGIGDMARAFDEFVFDRTDPARVSARMQAERDLAERQLSEELARSERQRLDAARSSLDDKIAILADLLEDTEDLPADVTGYEATLEKARKTRLADDPVEMSRVAVSAGASADTLKAHVEEKESERRNHAFILFLQMLCAVLTLLIIGWVLWQRRRYQTDLTGRFANKVSQWEADIRNATGRYVDFYGKRDGIVALSEVEGRTAALYKAVTTEVDAIYTAVRAMELHVEKCKAKASKASFFDYSPLLTALRDIDGSFEFDTGVLNDSDLFGHETHVVEVIPLDFERELRARFKASVDGWKQLEQAADARLKAVEDVYPHSKLDALIIKADQNDIPHRWLADHPLFGDTDADKALYDEINALRWSDPISYMERIGQLRAQHEVVEARLDRLVEAVQTVRAKRLDTYPIVSTVLDPADDPGITFDDARREEDKLAGRLASRDTVEEVEEQATKVAGLYQKAIDQVATVKSAVDNVKAALSQAEVACVKARLLRDSVMIRVHTAAAIHTNCKAESYIRDGDKYLKSADRHITKAQHQITEHRHVNARRNTDEAVEAVKQAVCEFDQATKHCKALDEQKAGFEHRSASMIGIRENAVRRAKKHGGKETAFPAFCPPVLSNGVHDYAALTVAMALQESVWESRAREARRAHEAAEEARRAEETRRKMERGRAESERRHRDSYYESSWSSSSSSSSSSSDWGGGGFGGSSGDSGGGGFGGSSGDW